MRRRVWCLLVLASAGCGLSEYGGQMASEKARVQYWDDENKRLGKKITMPVLPEDKDKKSQKWDIFLRLPRGVNESPATIQGKEEANLFGPLAQYETVRNDYGIQTVYLGFADNQPDFIKKVYTQFGTSAKNETTETIPRSPSLMMGTGTGKNTNQDIVIKRQPDRARDESNAILSFNFYERDRLQVAVVFKLDKDNGTKADEAIKFSLATLGVGFEQTGQLTTAYNKRNRTARKK